MSEKNAFSRRLYKYGALYKNIFDEIFFQRDLMIFFTYDISECMYVYL